jgi:hypothetical protein
MKKMIITAFMLSLVSVSAIASVLDPSENRYIRSLAAKNMEALVSTEREISRLSHNDRELVRIPRKLDTHSRANWTVGA